MTSFQVKFVTKEDKWAIAALPYSLNSSASPNELNALVNTVLGEHNDKWAPREFDFLVCDLLLRTTLEEHLNDVTTNTGKIFSAEEELFIEYVEKQSPPEAFNSLLNDDWVSCVHANESFIINGCYDGIINIWQISGQHLISIPAHGSAVKDIRFVCKDKLKEVGADLADADVVFISASHDENCILWKFDSVTKEVDCLSVFKGHERSVDCIDVYNDIMASGSFDNRLKIWSLVEKADESEKRNAKKKQKLEENEDNIESKSRTPIITMGGHTEGITDVVWLNEPNNTGPIELASCSMDNTIRLWDIEVAEEKSTLKGSKAFLAIDYSCLNHCLITGSCDRHIRLWDPRSQEGTLVKAVFSNHSGWVSAVCWSTTDEHLFISGSYDNCVKLWDTRSHKAPLYDLIGHGEKVLAVDWSNPRFMISGGADNHLKIFENKVHR